MQITVNGQSRQVADGATVAALLRRAEARPASPWPSRSISNWSHGSATPSIAWPRAIAWKSSRWWEEDRHMSDTKPQRRPIALRIGSHTFSSRLIVGTGKYASYEAMREALDISGTECITVAVRRERLIDAAGKNLLDFIDTQRYTILPNTAGCFTADDAVRVARLGREILSQLDNPGADWVKLEVLGDTKTLLPDPMATLQATEKLVAEGFQVLVYTSDDPVMAKRLKEAGATSVMPAGSPIGSGQGVLNPNAIRICLEYLKEDDPDYPVIVDAGVGTASDVTDGHGTGRRRRAAEHGHRPRQGPAADGPGDAAGLRVRPAGLSCRPDSQEALRHGQQPDRGRDFAHTVIETAISCVIQLLERRLPRLVGRRLPGDRQIDHRRHQDKEGCHGQQAQAACEDHEQTAYHSTDKPNQEERELIAVHQLFGLAKGVDHRAVAVQYQVVELREHQAQNDARHDQSQESQEDN